jgi:hypothetical protein
MAFGRRQRRIMGCLGDDVANLQRRIDGAITLVEQLDRELRQRSRITSKLSRFLQGRLPLLGFETVFLGLGLLADSRNFDEPAHPVKGSATDAGPVVERLTRSRASRFSSNGGPVKRARDRTVIDRGPMVGMRARTRLGRLRRVEPLLYALVAGGLTLWVACRFYASVRFQTSLTSPPLSRPGEWSAPLDDVFIHFDFARAIARGHPFEWSEGNGYSSGGTSLLYPFVLAPGWLVGFRGSGLVLWAAVIACVSSLGLLLASRRLFRDLPRWTSYLAPVAVLGVGVLAWSLFSGMEVAFFLGLWGGALIAWDDLIHQDHGDQAAGPARIGWMAILLGSWGALLVATRPEAVAIVAMFGVSAAYYVSRARGPRVALGVVSAVAIPGMLVVVGHALVNRVLTGDATAAGALTKLEIHHPHLSAEQVWDAWTFHVRYQVLRVTQHHLSEIPVFGWIPWVFAAAALLFRATRRYAILLLGSAIGWVLLVALNGQVRWQNERYSMPALAWLMLAAALGFGALACGVRELRRRGALRGPALMAIGLLAALFADHQIPRYRDQLWFFGRASRNIRDQHTVAGRLIRSQLEPPRRVLVGDAGAIPYASDLPALDIIGLGGYRGLPFARATRLGVGAALELIERMPPSERPDLLAIYPSWWGVFPLWFGQVIDEVPVAGNVICGGASKVLYRPRWQAFEGSHLPSSLQPGEVVIDELDVADLVSEREHEYVVSSGGVHIEMKLLPSLAKPERDLWDAGRIVAGGASEKFVLRGFAAERAVRLVLRIAPPRNGAIDVYVDEALIATVSHAASDGWLEPTVLIPPARVRPNLSVRLTSSSERVIHHVWAVGTR